MCIACDFSRMLSRSNAFPTTRRGVLGQAGALTAMAVAARFSPGLGAAFAADRPAVAQTPLSAKDGKADWLFLNGTIHTLNPTQPSAQAVAVRGTQIVYVGDTAGAQDWRGPKTRVVDLGGRMLLPGFIDSHNHLASLAVTKLGVNVRGLVGKEFESGRHRRMDRHPVAQCAAARPGLDAEHLVRPSTAPRREWLDEVTGDRPMYLISEDSHQVWFNTAAMKAAGIGAHTPDPEPGKQFYARDPNGVPNGLAVEGAASVPLLVALGMFAPETVRESQRLTIDRASSWDDQLFRCRRGCRPGERRSESVWRNLIARDNAGDLPLRIVGSVWTRNYDDDPRAITEELVAWNQEYRSDHVRITTCKMWTDGTWATRTALLLEPYADEPANRGSIVMTPEHIKAQVEAVHKAGFDMHIHCDADGSTRATLDAIEDVQKRLGQQGRRHTICHVSLTHPDDVKRFKPLGINVNGTPLWATTTTGARSNALQRCSASSVSRSDLSPMAISSVPARTSPLGRICRAWISTRSRRSFSWRRPSPANVPVSPTIPRWWSASV